MLRGWEGEKRKRTDWAEKSALFFPFQFKQEQKGESLTLLHTQLLRIIPVGAKKWLVCFFTWQRGSVWGRTFYINPLSMRAVVIMYVNQYFGIELAKKKKKDTLKFYSAAPPSKQRTHRQKNVLHLWECHIFRIINLISYKLAKIFFFRPLMCEL